MNEDKLIIPKTTNWSAHNRYGRKFSIRNADVPKTIHVSFKAHASSTNVNMKKKCICNLNIGIETNYKKEKSNDAYVSNTLYVGVTMSNGQWETINIHS